jgi:anthranilate phosphoribosyltransferase
MLKEGSIRRTGMNDTIRNALGKAVDNIDLSREEATAAMEEIMSGNATQAQIGAFITALRMKGETVDEITGCAQVMRRKATKIHTDHELTVDTCGTGGDCSGTFNISTVSAFVVAGAGIPVAKHGNRSVSSKCGSADLLMKLGVNVNAPVEKVEKCLDEIGIAFLYAPLFHGAMKHAIGPRREIGIRTVFNILGPITNPAGSLAQVVGVYDKNLTVLLANVLNNLGSLRAFVVHGNDGLDEITTTDRTWISEIKEGKVVSYSVTPEDFGFHRTRIEELLGKDEDYNAVIAGRILGGEKSPFRDIVLLNAAYAIVAGGGASDIQGGIGKAEDSIDSGAASEKLRKLIEYTNK